MSDAARPVRILLVEDSPGDVNLTREALRRAKVANELEVVGDGVEAMEYLRGEGAYQDQPPPDLILLDLNLPRMDGREVLAAVKSDPQLKHIPVIVLTTSTAEADILASYQLHANAYVSKPVAFEEFLGALQQFEGFWLQLVRLAR
jgi:two-component system response regulator